MKNFKTCRKLRGFSFPSSCNGFLFPGAIPHDITTLEERITGHLRENKRLPSQLVYITAMARLAHRSKQELHLVLMPARSDYVNTLPVRAELFEPVDKLLEGRASNPIIDFYSKSVFEDEDFYDFDHLNLNGAKKFSKQLKEFFHD